MDAKNAVEKLLEVGFVSKGLWMRQDDGSYTAELSELEHDPVDPWGQPLDLKRGWTPHYDGEGDLTHLSRTARYKEEWVKLTAFND
jgi:hypothetical protein